MLRVVLVAGELTEAVKEVFDKYDIEIVKDFYDIRELWTDILTNGGVDYLDVDRVLIVPNTYISEKEMSVIDQMINLQSAFIIEGLNSVIHFLTKDPDTYAKIESNIGEYLLYQNSHIMAVESLSKQDLARLAQGNYDSVGLKHPDFLKVVDVDNELDRVLEETEEQKPEKVEREVFEGFVDKKKMSELDREAQKLAKEKELAERKASRVEKKSKEKANKVGLGGLFGKKDTGSVVEKPVKEKAITKQKPVKEKKVKAPKLSKKEVSLYKGIIAVTGDRQSGVSTTVSNMADVYAKNGNSVLIVDLDTKRRFQTKIYPEFYDAIALENRVMNGLLASLINTGNLEDVAAVVSDNVALLSISDEVDRVIHKFANRPFEAVFSAQNLVNLLSYAKSMFDVVIVDLPFEKLHSVGNLLSYVDKSIMCIPNTMYHIDNLLEIEIDELLLVDEIVTRTLLSKSKILLTKYNENSKFEGKEVTEEFVMDTLSLLDDSQYHLEVIGRIPYIDDYESQVGKGKPVVSRDLELRNHFEEFMSMI